MYSGTISKSLRTRIIAQVFALLATSLAVVSIVIYFLFARSLRKSDQELLLNLRDAYLHSHHKEALLPERVSPEILFVILDKEGRPVLEHYPKYIDHDFEDEDEIRQVKNAVLKLPLKEGLANILILSGEEEKDIFEHLEYSLRLLARDNRWETVLPIIDNDLFEVIVSRDKDSDWVIIGRSSEQREESLASIRYISLAVILPFLLCGLVFSWVLSEKIVRPIKNLGETMKRIKTGATQDRADLTGRGDEIDELGQEFNSLIDQNHLLVRNLKEVIDNVAHDLRTPLTRLRTSAENALIMSDDPNVLKEAISDAMENSEHVLKLLNAIMDVSEAENGILKLREENFRFDQLLENILELYSNLAEEKNISIVHPDLKIVECSGDIQRITQAIGNLLDNAIKYSPPHSKIEVGLITEGAEIWVSVTDHGPGISQSDQERIWDRMFRGDSSRSQSGSGIGLSLVKAIVEAHGGHSEVRSSIGAGSTFIIRLPKCHKPERFPSS